MGTVLRIDGPISFLGDVDPATGVLTTGGRAYDIRGKVLVFTEGKGSTVGSYVIYNLALAGNAPLAMVMLRADAIITMGCIAAGIPLVHRVPVEDFASIGNGQRLAVNSARGQVRRV